MTDDFVLEYKAVIVAVIVEVCIILQAYVRCGR
jgi:hypothetical protein